MKSTNSMAFEFVDTSNQGILKIDRWLKRL